MSGTTLNPTPVTAPQPALNPTPATAPDPGPTATDPNLVVGRDGSLDLSGIVNELAIPGLSGDTLTLSAATAAEGTILLTKAGDFVYEPIGGANGSPQNVGWDITSASGTTPGSTSGGATQGTSGPATDTISYTVTDQLGHTVQGTADVTIDPGPILANGSYVVGHDQTVNLTAYIGSLITPGLKGDIETVTSISADSGQPKLTYDAENGVPDGRYRIDYTAPDAAPGAQSGAGIVHPATLDYTVTDQYGDQASASVAITVDPGPAATDPTLVIGRSASGFGTLDLSQIVGKLASPGLSGDTLTLTAASGGSYGGIVAAANGDLVYEGKFAPVNDAFNYTVTDQLGDTVQGTAHIVLDPGPTAANGTITVGDGQTENLASYIQNLVTPGLPGDHESIASVSTESGSVSLSSFSNASGAPSQTAVGYTAPASGSDILSYTVVDENGVKATGTVAITVDPGPTATKGSFTIGHGQTANLAGYVESLVTPGLSGDTVQLLSASAANGQASLATTKAGTALDYTAPASGTDVLTYSVDDQFVSSTSTIVSGNQISYVKNTGTSAPVSSAVEITVDPGPTTTTATASVQLGQSLDLTNTILAADKPGLAGDTLSIVADNTKLTVGNVSLVNGDLVYSATGPGLANLAANGALSDSFDYTVTDQYGDFATGKVNVTVTNPLNVINGGPYGGSTIEGTAGADQITAYGYNNTIYDNGGNDIVNAGQGQGTVYAGGGNVTVNLSGYNNVVSGGDGADIVSGSQGNTSVALGNGSDVVQLGGYNNSVTLGNGSDTIAAGAGNEIVTAGNGNDTITAGGYSNQIKVGNGNDTIGAGAGGATITGGSGTDSVQLQGYGNSVSFTGGNDTIGGGAGSDVFHLTGGSANLVLQGSNEMVFLNGTNAVINDQGSGLGITVAGGGADVIQNFAADPSAFVDLVGGIGGFASASQVLAALTPDGHGGTMLSLGGSSSFDFAGVPVTQVNAANFHIG